MHVNIILLTEQLDKTKAEDRVISFMKNYTNLFDYYLIGGRWDNRLPDRSGKLVPLTLLRNCLEEIKAYALEASIPTMPPETDSRRSKGLAFRALSNYLLEELWEGCTVYNIDWRDYSIPHDTHNWYAISIDAHY